MKMKAIKIYATVIVALLLLTSCEEGYSGYEYRGVMYTDSTMTETVGNAKLSFYEVDGMPSPEKHNLTPVGTAVTDNSGRWAFSYIRNLENPYTYAAKMSRDYSRFSFMITSGGDTLYWGEAGKWDGENCFDMLYVYPIHFDWSDSSWWYDNYENDNYICW